MSFYHKLHNRHLVNELRHELNSDILLLGGDGFSYFGHLQGIEDCRVAILTPAINSVTADVEIITPGGCLITADFVRIDLCSIIAKGTGIVSDPIYSPETCCSREVDSDFTLENTEEFEREYDFLIKQLRRLIGDKAIITTVGGFLFEGILSEVCHDLAILKINQIYISGSPQYISDSNIRSAVINLEAITSVASGTHCCNIS